MARAAPVSASMTVGLAVPVACLSSFQPPGFLLREIITKRGAFPATKFAATLPLRTLPVALVVGAVVGVVVTPGIVVSSDNEVIFTSFVFTSFLKLVGIRHQRIKT